MAGDMDEVTAGCEHEQVVVDAKLGKERIDRFDLHTGAAAAIAQFHRLYVIADLWYEG